MNEVGIPVIIPLIFAVITSFIGSRVWTFGVGLAGMVLHFCSASFLYWGSQEGGIKTIVFGDWLPPFGVTLVSDLFSSLFLVAISITFFVTYWYSYNESRQDPSRVRTPLIFILLASVSLCLLTGDFFNLFVAFEMMLASSYALVSLEMPRDKLKWGYSYLLVNLVGTLGFLCAAAMIYGYTSQLNLAAITLFLKDKGDDPLVTGWAYLLLGIFGMKAAVFPLYFWLPKTYSNLPPSLAALFSGSLTKVGIYVLLRVFVLLLPMPLGAVSDVVLIVAGITMLIGVIGAVARSSIKEIFSYHIISQIGYMVMGLGLNSVAAVTAAVLFTIHNIWVKSSLFLIGGVVSNAYKTDELKPMGNLSKWMPALTTLFLFQALSLTGLPPLSGFWGKYLLILESIRLERYILAAVALVTSWLTLFSMIKIWIGAFWKEPEAKPVFLEGSKQVAAYGPIVFLVAASLALGLGVEYFYVKAESAAEQVFAMNPYVETVLGAGGKGE